MTQVIDKNKQYQTRDGREVKIYHIYDQDGACVHGAIKDINGKWITWSWNKNGQISISGPHFSDLIEVKPRVKETIWANIYREKGGIEIGARQKTRELCAKNRGPNCIACIPIELDFEEGEGL